MFQHFQVDGFHFIQTREGRKIRWEEYKENLPGFVKVNTLLIKKTSQVFTTPQKNTFFSFLEVGERKDTHNSDGKQTSDGIVTISSRRWCCCIGSEIRGRFAALEVVVVVVFVLANVLSFVVVVVDDAARLLAAGSGR